MSLGSSNSVNITIFAWILIVACFIIDDTTSLKCEFEAIFNFGDSNSDTGGFWAAFPAQSGPFGMTFFHKPVGRATDGRLVIDFLAQALGFPFISPYLQSIGSNYVHGANYATLASTVLLPNTSLFVTGISPFSLAIQLNQMKDFKLRVEQYSSDPQESKRLPSSDVFGKSIYSFYIGQNDFTSNLNSIGVEGVKQYLPKVVDQIANTIKEIYAIGGRTFLVLNMAPVGCYPSLLTTFPHQRSDIDPFGCLIPLNDGVIYYNNLLKKALELTRQSLPSDAKVIYVDIFSIMLELFRHPTSHGLKYGPRACCGYGGGAYNFNPNLYCGNTKLVEGKSVSAQACSDPYNYVSWDGIHASDVANKIVTNAILSGQYFEPPFPLNQLCDLQPIG